MKSTVSFEDFSDSFTGEYKNTFTYEGKKALFDYLEEYEESADTELELDPIAFACMYTEYSDATEAASNYFEFEGMTYGEDGGELETPEQVEAKAVAFLQERTTVIEFNGGIIMSDF